MLLTAAHYDFPWEAQLARARLEAEGIEAWVADEHTINMQWLYSNALGGVRVQVAAEDLHRARTLLAEDRSRDLEREAGTDPLICPCCGSDRTRYRPLGRRLAFLIFIGLDFPLYPVRHAVQCDACGALSRLER